ncbi:hypothetical protein NTGBS_920023 [Candidatus Nitrotoga sp. BS]|nr:hypothetical protein NTGBS_920023 [Candidatus Nitrotoga sp. BS]
MARIRTSEGSAHGAGVRPFLEDVVEQGMAVSARGGLGELGNKGCQRAVAADRFAQTAHLAASAYRRIASPRPYLRQDLHLPVRRIHHSG